MKKTSFWILRRSSGNLSISLKKTKIRELYEMELTGRRTGWERERPFEDTWEVLGWILNDEDLPERLVKTGSTSITELNIGKKVEILLEITDCNRSDIRVIWVSSLDSTKRRRRWRRRCSELKGRVKVRSIPHSTEVGLETFFGHGYTPVSLVTWWEPTSLTIRY